jgi:hypothetical protein
LLNPYNPSLGFLSEKLYSPGQLHIYLLHNVISVINFIHCTEVIKFFSWYMTHNLIIDYVVESTRGSLSFVLHHSPCGSNFKCGIISHVLDVSESNNLHSPNTDWSTIMHILWTNQLVPMMFDLDKFRLF